ncbi:LytR C-terminal domain-containing protein [Alloscardovia macacae]|uniref:Cell wall integrity and stress response protein 1 n=1 Tax=Alloscardovia macacae TaxID=1160091 RepID=A0A261F3E4_9BIFI|nr:LytR C-terminal domain-containing protein [Alloscardovia macacae]OZG53634.1 cell wall integrity and stress response protein 1 [Alloscardovia macacae]
MAQAHAYPRDEFDHYAGQHGGAHRGKRTVLARLKPYIIAILVAALCALAFLTWTNGWLGSNGLNWLPGTSSSRTAASSKASNASKSTTSNSSSSSNSSASSSTNSADSSNASSTTNSTTSSTTDQSQQNTTTQDAQSAQAQQAAQPVNKTRTITVYNGTGVSGYAARRASVLTSDGYSNVTAANPTNRSTLPSANTVWYVENSDKSTAEEVASKLGISNVEQVASLGQGNIAVVLMSQQ